MFGFLESKGFAIKTAGCFHTAIIFLFIVFRVSKHIQKTQTTPNIIVFILGILSLLLLGLYLFIRNWRINRMGKYVQSRCSFRFKLGIYFSLISWSVFMISNLLSFFIEKTQTQFVWYSYIGLAVCFLFSSAAMASFRSLERRLI